MIGNYKIVTLCGSTKFKKEFLEIQKKTYTFRIHRNFCRPIWTFRR